jgi:hypothetical protein
MYFLVNITKNNKNVLITQYFSGDKIENILMGGACSACGGEERIYRVLAGKPEGKRRLGRLKGRWEYNIKIDLQ